jgi:hypothetical protein
MENVRADIAIRESMDRNTGAKLAALAVRLVAVATSTNPRVALRLDWACELLLSRGEEFPETSVPNA